MNLHDVATMLRRGWWLALGLAALAASVAHSYAAGKPVTYSSSSQSYVVVNNSGTSGGDAFNAGQAAQAKMASYSALATSPVVTKSVAVALQLSMDPDEIASHLSVTFAPGTVLINVSATAATAREASDLAAETTRQLVKQVEVLETPAPGVPAWTRLVPITESTTPVASKPGTSKLTAAGGLGGLIVGAGIAFLLVRLDPRVRTREGIADVFEAVPVSADEPRAVRAAVLAAAGRARLVAAMGVRADSWPTTRRTAEALAATGASVLVVDARSELGGATADRGLSERDGLAELLRRKGEDFAGSLRDVADGESGPVAVIPSGTGRADLSDLLASASAARVFERLCADYDHVLVDGVGRSANTGVGAATRLYVVRPGRASAERYRSEAGLDGVSGVPRVLALTRPWTPIGWALGLVRGAKR